MSKAKSPSYTLHYFNGKGAGENARLLFVLKGVEYTDKRYTSDEWKLQKESMPLKAMPVLDIDGKQLCQSNAINRFLARTFDFYGKDNMEAARIDEIHEAAVELGQGFFKIAFGGLKDPEKKEQMEKFTEGPLPTILAFLEMRLRENEGGKGFFVGSEISLADVAVFKLLTFLQEKKCLNALKAKCPTVEALLTRVAAIPSVAAWLIKRPKTDM